MGLIFFCHVGVLFIAVCGKNMHQNTNYQFNMHIINYIHKARENELKEGEVKKELKKERKK